MLVSVQLTEKEKECLIWLSQNSWKYIYVDISDFPLKEINKHYTFRSFYKQELLVLWQWEVFKVNQIKGTAEVNEFWLGLFRKALKNQ